VTYLVLGLLLTVDGGSSLFAAPLYEQCPRAEPSIELDGGWRLLSPQRTARLDCLMVTAAERVVQLERAPPPLSSTTLLFAAGLGLLGLLFGLYGGWELRALLFH